MKPIALVISITTVLASSAGTPRAALLTPEGPAGRAAAEEAPTPIEPRLDRQVEAISRHLDYELAKEQRSVQLAQAAADLAGESNLRAAEVSVNAAPPPPRPILPLLGKSNPGKTLVVRSSDQDPKTQSGLEEDLAVMTRVLDKAVAEKFGEDHKLRAMGLEIFLTSGGSPARALYLEDYGAMFLLNINFPLLPPPPTKAEPGKEETETDSAWEEARQELYGADHRMVRFYDQALGFEAIGQPAQEYDQDKVDKLREVLVATLKNATKIRHLSADESVTVCVIGGANIGTQITRAIRQEVKTPGTRIRSGGPTTRVVVQQDDGSPAQGRGTVMTLRAKKSDIDAFAQGRLELKEFRGKVKMALYPGETGAWGGGLPIGGLYKSSR